MIIKELINHIIPVNLLDKFIIIFLLAGLIIFQIYCSISKNSNKFEYKNLLLAIATVVMPCAILVIVGIIIR
ncbi:hypothetical protein FDE98_17865 [Clostridium sporogenes]|uniref:Uncharacterized protein n=1 Tax=Clostridium sporogenes TaxID=1509 RepID=A0A7X5PDD2_CLOSG|nr:hypothetical protein [Clostridium sporogenes]AJD29085.1 putative membrane protein [Clostridium botulinum Prevot_594]NFL98407.1 hypothetical protein [Clostridium botulinum]NFP56267.1 hypothetical protein [Clostridium botulinum]NFQ18223.1 hypothetical protein [Clostridium sporogenes]NFQ22180.1 hypothetical protein [Clostridium sporogenes]